MLALPDATALGTAAARGGPTVLPGADQELMASMALHHHVAAMPVVDEAGRLVGVVGPTTLMGIMHRLAEITRESDRARQAIEEPPLRRARHRLPWLVVGLGLERLIGGEL